MICGSLLFLRSIPLTARSGWVPLGPVGTTISSIAIDPGTPSTFYAGTSSRLYKSTDSGTSWSEVRGGLSTGAVTAIAIASDGTLFAGVAVDPAVLPWVSIIQKSVDGAATWTESLVLEATLVNDIVVDPLTPSNVFAATSAGVYRSGDSGTSWAAASNGLPSSDVRAIAIDPTAPSTLYAGTFGGGVFKSSNAGLTWKPLGGTPELIADVEIGASASVVYAAGLLSGPAPPEDPRESFVFSSTDGGKTWSDVAGGAQGYLYDLTEFAIDRFNPTNLYAGTLAGVYRSVDGGSHWTAANDGLTAVAVSSLVVDAVLPHVVYAGTARGGLFRRVFEETGPCVADATSLCLNSSRFRVEVSWRAENLGTSGQGYAVPVTSDAGSFWFFNASNLELMIKVLDGRAINGKFWVFYGALSNVEYTITVTDTLSDTSKTYFNPQGQLASVADTSAF